MEENKEKDIAYEKDKEKDKKYINAYTYAYTNQDLDIKRCV